MSVHPIVTPSSHCLVRSAFFSPAGVPWLARDVLLVAVENGGNKLKAVDALGGWLHTYRSPSATPSQHYQRHNTSTSFDPLSSSLSSASSFTFYRSGSILAALCLDIPLHTPVTSAFTLHVGGLYGLSPNLDIVSVLLSMLQRRGLPVSVADTFPTHSPLSSAPGSSAPAWLKDEHKGLLRSMVHHVTGEATGFHGHFIANNIDAITLQALPSTTHPHRYHGGGFTGPLLLSLDAFFHSMNNLIEKLHHSTWLYLLVSPTHFVTMSKYVYAFALLAAPLPLIALSRLYCAGQKRWLQAGGVALWLYGLGWSVVGAGLLLRGLDGLSAVATVVAVVAGGTAVGGATSGWKLTEGFDWRTVQAIVLLATFFVVSPLAILNFPLSIALLSFLVPLAVHVRPINRPASSGLSTLLYHVGRLSQLVLLLLLSPVTLFVIYAVYWRLTVLDASVALMVGLSHVDNLLYLLLPGVYLPVYLLSWGMWLLPTSAASTPSILDHMIHRPAGRGQTRAMIAAFILVSSSCMVSPATAMSYPYTRTASTAPCPLCPSATPPPPCPPAP